MLNDLLKDPLFAKSAPCDTLCAKPLGFVDVGARGGVYEVVEPLAGVTAVLGFEPDEEECARMRAELIGSPWVVCDIEPWALGSEEGKAQLHLLSAATNHSLRAPNVDLIRRYNMVKFVEVGNCTLRTKRLDQILFGPRAAEGYWGEFLKLDTQGTELEILAGAQRTLSERTVTIITEVAFCQIYEGQKLFSEIELFLRPFGFSFYGFSTTHHRARKYLDKRKEVGRERALYADAVFFKDALPGGPQPAPLSERGNHVLFACAILLGYYDFALELALGTWAVGEEADRIKALIHKHATLPPSQSYDDAIALAERVRSNPERANIEVGRFVDQRRGRCDYDDVPAEV